MLAKNFGSLESESLLKLHFLESLSEASLRGFPYFESTINSFAIDEHQDPIGVVLYRQIEKNLCEIDFIAVKKAYRGRGVARNLLSKLSCELWLEVHENNKNAVAFYEALGFKKVGFREAYYGPFGAHLMEKKP